MAAASFVYRYGRQHFSFTQWSVLSTHLFDLSAPFDIVNLSLFLENLASHGLLQLFPGLTSVSSVLSSPPSWPCSGFQSWTWFFSSTYSLLALIQSDGFKCHLDTYGDEWFKPSLSSRLVHPTVCLKFLLGCLIVNTYLSLPHLTPDLFSMTYSFPISVDGNSTLLVLRPVFLELFRFFLSYPTLKPLGNPFDSAFKIYI